MIDNRAQILVEYIQTMYIELTWWAVSERVAINVLSINKLVSIFAGFDISAYLIGDSRINDAYCRTSNFLRDLINACHSVRLCDVKDMVAKHFRDEEYFEVAQ